jgi:hypothetical protein
MKLLDTELQKRHPNKEVNLQTLTLNVGGGEGYFADLAFNREITVGLDVSHQLIARWILIPICRTLRLIDHLLQPYSNAVAWDDDLCTFHRSVN